MKTLLLLVVLLLAYRPGAAQRARAATPPDSVAAAHFAAPDTVAAIHRLFGSRRKDVARAVFTNLGAGFTNLGAGVAEGALVLGLLSSNGVVGQLIAPIFIIPIGITAVLGTGIYFFQYNHRHEQHALTKLQAHKLPKWVKRELKPRFFL